MAGSTGATGAGAVHNPCFAVIKLRASSQGVLEFAMPTVSAPEPTPILPVRDCVLGLCENVRLGEDSVLVETDDDALVMVHVQVHTTTMPPEAKGALGLFANDELVTTVPLRASECTHGLALLTGLTALRLAIVWDSTSAADHQRTVVAFGTDESVVVLTRLV